MKKIAVVGAGYWGKNLLRNFRELGALGAICENDPENPNLRDYREFRLYTDYEDLLSDAGISAVALATPAVMHFDMVKRALECGKDVYVEKPLALTVNEGQQLVKSAADAHRILMVGHILQYHPAVMKLKEMISAGELGKVQYIYSNRLNIGKLRTEENILWSFAPHDISIILMLLGQEPVSVSATGTASLNKEIYDTTLTTLEFHNGVLGHIFVSWLHPFKEQKLVVVGSKGMVVFDDVSKEKLFLYPHKIEWKEGKVPVAHKAEYQVVPFEPAEPLKEELKHFIHCLETRQTPKTDGREGLRVLKILEQAELSLGKRSGSAASVPPSRLPAHRIELFAPDVFIHESAYVDDGTEIGEGSKIWHFSHILKGSKIGKNCIIGQNVSIGPDVVIGNRCKVQGSRFKVQGSRFKVQGSRFKVQGSRLNGCQKSLSMFSGYKL